MFSQHVHIRYCGGGWGQSFLLKLFLCSSGGSGTWFPFPCTKTTCCLLSLRSPVSQVCFCFCESCSIYSRHLIASCRTPSGPTCLTAHDCCCPSRIWRQCGVDPYLSKDRQNSQEKARQPTEELSGPDMSGMERHWVVLLGMSVGSPA